MYEHKATDKQDADTINDSLAFNDESLRKQGGVKDRFEH